MPEPEAGTGRADRYAATVPKSIQRFPDGATGCALLLLRLSSSVIVYPALASLWLSAAISTFLILALSAGLGTRAAASTLCLLIAGVLAMGPRDPALFLLAQAGQAVAILLLGPGAYSFDAYRFGRRVISLGPHSPDRGSRE